MKLLFVKYVFALLPFFFVMDNTAWKVKSSSITFKIKNAGVSVDGSFTGLVADIKFNPLKPEEAVITASVNSKTINTDNSMRDEHLRKAEYFDVEKFPKITLQSVKIEKTGPITYKGLFKLTMKGVTKEVIIPFNFMKIPEKTEFKGSFSINRRDYGVGGNSISLSDNATINLSIIVTE
ncbi:MAG: YceI family protein [Bacteroidetes bacterium]|nr:YceI family protein [Bacteroidota bacterium]